MPWLTLDLFGKIKTKKKQQQPKKETKTTQKIKDQIQKGMKRKLTPHNIFMASNDDADDGEEKDGSGERRRWLGGGNAEASAPPSFPLVQDS